MTRAEFVARRNSDWKLLDQLLTRAERKHSSKARVDGFESVESLGASSTSGARRKLTAADATRIPLLYRAVSEDLALTQHRGYGVDLAERLNSLCLRGYHTLHGTKKSLLSRAVHFVLIGFPRLVRRERRVTLFALLLFFGPFFGFMAAGFFAPEWVFGALPDDMRVQLESSFSPNDAPVDIARDAESNLVMFGHYIWNNVGIAFRTFAGGILCGLGSIFFLLSNGIVLGAAFGYAYVAGFDRSFMAFTSGHGAPELIGIALSGAAGLKLGLAILAPGRRTRRLALRDDGRVAVRMALGAGAMITFAAFIEAFWSANALEPTVKYVVGGCVWFGTILWLLVAGRGGEDLEAMR